MYLTSSAIENGVFADKYGKRGSQFSPNGMPTYSILRPVLNPLRWCWKIRMQLPLVVLFGPIG